MQLSNVVLTQNENTQQISSDKTIQN